MTNPARDAALAAVEAEMDEITARADKRREQAADGAMRAANPAATDWMHPEELTRLEELRLEHIRLFPTTAEIRARVAVKRAARRAQRRDMVLSCTTGVGCEHEYQDQRYGKDMRVHEPCEEDGQNRGSATCTVCGRVRTNPDYVPNLRVVKESEA